MFGQIKPLPVLGLYNNIDPILQYKIRPSRTKLMNPCGPYYYISLYIFKKIVGRIESNSTILTCSLFVKSNSSRHLLKFSNISLCFAMSVARINICICCGTNLFVANIIITSWRRWMSAQLLDYIYILIVPHDNYTPETLILPHGIDKMTTIYYMPYTAYYIISFSNIHEQTSGVVACQILIKHFTRIAELQLYCNKAIWEITTALEKSSARFVGGGELTPLWCSPSSFY